MKKNLGSVDRGIRILIAAILLVLYFSGIVTGTLGMVGLAVSAIFVVTSMVGFCPLYSLIGVNTCARV